MLIFCAVKEYSPQIIRTAIFLVLTCCFFGLFTPKSVEARSKSICKLIETAAEKNGLPVAFFTRLIWKESHFHARAVSHKGAQGIAQFMPETAKLWGLKDPFNPAKAIPASARLLAFLKKDLGNLGLAAAAYNAGRLRLQAWKKKGGWLPEETEDYVFAITGWPADYWRFRNLPLEEVRDEKDAVIKSECRKPPLTLFPGQERTQLAPWEPWGVHLASNRSRRRVLGIYTRLQQKYPQLLAKQKPMLLIGFNLSLGRRPLYTVRLGAPNRQQAIRLCNRYRAAGGACVVRKS